MFFVIFGGIKLSEGFREWTVRQKLMQTNTFLYAVLSRDNSAKDFLIKDNNLVDYS